MPECIIDSDGPSPTSTELKEKAVTRRLNLDSRSLAFHQVVELEHEQGPRTVKYTDCSVMQLASKR